MLAFSEGAVKVLAFAEGVIKKVLASLKMCWHGLKELFKMCWQACHDWDLKMKNISPYKCNFFQLYASHRPSMISIDKRIYM